MTSLGIPTVPPRASTDVGNGIAFTSGHHFAVAAGADINQLAAQLTVPLSVIVQVTKRCDFDCSFCSETLMLPDPTIAQLETMRDHLAGVPRVFLSGGEPLMRRDFGDIVSMYFDAGHLLGIPTNATHGLDHARNLAGKVAYVNVGLEGPRATTSRVRGNYDKVMAGIRALQAEGLPLSLSAVVYRSTLAALPFTYQIADVLDAGKLKLIMPLRKGNALDLDEHEFITDAEAGELFGRLTELRATHEWRPALRMTTWTPQNEGHMILVEPTGRASAWPVYKAKDLLQPLGNLLEEPVTEIWRRYPFKVSHLTKYLGRSISAVARSAGGGPGA
jgi:MoaA/NifB/PqqE/SkfB family radical SAM enzyme